jgi:hypothetical protein
MQQVMHADPVRRGELNQVRPGQPGQYAADLVDRAAGKRRAAVKVTVGSRVQPEQPESPGGVGV